MTNETMAKLIDLRNTVDLIDLIKRVPFYAKVTENDLVNGELTQEKDAELKEYSERVNCMKGDIIRQLDLYHQANELLTAIHAELVAQEKENK